MFECSEEGTWGTTRSIIVINLHSKPWYNITSM